MSQPSPPPPPHTCLVRRGHVRRHAALVLRIEVGRRALGVKGHAFRERDGEFGAARVEEGGRVEVRDADHLVDDLTEGGRERDERMAVKTQCAGDEKMRWLVTNTVICILNF